MPDPVQRSVDLFASGFMCAESVLMALAEHQGVACDAIPSLATGLCAGISRTSNTCGALLGAIMGLGLAYGRDIAEDPPDPCFSQVQVLLDGFARRFGSTNCQELTGCDFLTDQGRADFRDKNIKEKQCFEYTREAVRLTLARLEEQA